MGDGGKGVIRIRTDSFDTEQCGHCVRMAHLKSITAIRWRMLTVAFANLFLFFFFFSIDATRFIYSFLFHQCVDSASAELAQRAACRHRHRLQSSRRHLRLEATADHQLIFNERTRCHWPGIERLHNRRRWSMDHRWTQWRADVADFVTSQSPYLIFDIHFDYGRW